MKPSERIRAVMKDKKISVVLLSEMMDKPKRTIYNSFYQDRDTKKDGMTFRKVEEYAAALGCEIIIRDKETGKEY